MGLPGRLSDFALRVAYSGTHFFASYEPGYRNFEFYDSNYRPTFSPLSCSLHAVSQFRKVGRTHKGCVLSNRRVGYFDRNGES